MDPSERTAVCNGHATSPRSTSIWPQCGANWKYWWSRVVLRWPRKHRIACLANQLSSESAAIRQLFQSGVSKLPGNVKTALARLLKIQKYSNELINSWRIDCLTSVLSWASWRSAGLSCRRPGIPVWWSALQIQCNKGSQARCHSDLVLRPAAQRRHISRGAKLICRIGAATA